MISESQAHAIIAEHLDDYKKRLKIEQWTVRHTFMRLEDGDMAECIADGKYDDIHIKVDLQQHDDEAEFVDTLQHELIHCVLADMDMSRDVAIAGLGNNEIGMYCSTYRHALERSVKLVQRIVFGDDDAD